MPNGVFNWTFQDAVNFLKNHSFLYVHTRGSHHYYVKQKFIVQVPYHGSKILKPKTLKGIIRQSGIPKDIWLGKSK